MRTVYVDVNGFELRLSSKAGGVQGEKNVTTLQIKFDDSWQGLGKRIVWRDATGENPVPIVLFDPMGEDRDVLSYATAIPAAALAYPGWCSFTLEGYTVNDGHWVKAMGAVGSLEVRASEVIYQPEDDTPSQTQQILAALGETEQKVFEIGQEARDSALKAKSWAVGGTESREGEDTDNARYYAQKAAEDAKKGGDAVREAQEAAQKAGIASGAAEKHAETARREAQAAGECLEIMKEVCREFPEVMDAGGVRKIIQALIPADAWEEAPANGYGLFFDLTDPWIAGRQVPYVIVAEDSLAEVYACGMCHTATAFDGYVRLKCAQRPARDIALTCVLLEKGGAVGELPVATEDTLGGIKASDSIWVDPDGTAHTAEGSGRVVFATDEEVERIINDAFGNAAPPYGPDIFATDEEVEQIIKDAFGDLPDGK